MSIVQRGTCLLETLQLVTGLKRDPALTTYFRMPTFKSRVKIIRAMLEQWQPPPLPGPRDQPQDPKEISRIIGKLSNLSLTRNGWVHGSWAFSTRDGSIAVFYNRERPNSETAGSRSKHPM